MLLSNSGLQAGNSFLLASLDSLVSVSRKGVVAGFYRDLSCLFLSLDTLLLCFRIRVSGSVYGSQLKRTKSAAQSHIQFVHICT